MAQEHVQDFRLFVIVSGAYVKRFLIEIKRKLISSSFRFTYELQASQVENCLMG